MRRINISVGLDPALFAELSAVAQQVERSRSWIVRRALKEWIAKQQKLDDERPS